MSSQPQLALRTSLEGADLVVVGAGLYGLTIANLVSERLGKKVTILESRPEIGGNAYSYIDSITGVEIHKYGSHLFHTSNKKVWDFVNRFSSFTNYRHQVFTRHNNTLYPMPINLNTINLIYQLHLSPSEAKELIHREVSVYNSEDSDSFEKRALKSIGPKLYQALIKGYTSKQWQTDPEKLPGSVFSRLPVRFNLNQSYFDDTYQGLPSKGFQLMFENMVNSPLIDVFCDSDYFDYAEHIKDLGKPLVYSGPIDRYFNYQFGPLTWRTLDFCVETLDVEDFQGTSVVNEADENVPYTRTHEFKHLHPEWTYPSEKTVIMREYSRFATLEDEPYYPVNTESDRVKLNSYRSLASKEKFTHFGGRLGTYQYLDMHMAIASAMSLFENVLTERLA
jgi:UDP-galactopyranose mutase